MKTPTKVRYRYGSVMTLAFLFIQPLGADEPLPDMSFLEFLGAAIEDRGEFVDPLTLYEDGLSEPPASGEQQAAASSEGQPEDTAEAAAIEAGTKEVSP